MTTPRVHVLVTADGKQAQGTFRQLESQLGSVRSAAIQLATAVAGGSLIAATAAAADSFNAMAAKVKLATLSSAEFSSAQKALLATALATQTPMADLVAVFAKMAPAFRQAGGSSAEAAAAVDLIAQSLKVSGATAAEASSFLLQFSQAMSSGVLRGEEFNAMMESNSRMAQLLADYLQVPIGALRKMAEEGKITAQVIRAAFASDAAKKIADDYASIPKSISGAMTNLNTQFTQFVGKVDEVSGGSRAFIGLIDLAARNLDTLATAAAIVGTVFAVRFAAGLAVGTIAALRAEIAIALAGRAAIASGIAATTAAVGWSILAKSLGGPVGIVLALGAAALAMFGFGEASNEAAEAEKKKAAATKQATDDATKAATEATNLENKRIDLLKQRGEAEKALAQAVRDADIEAAKRTKAQIDERIKLEEQKVAAIQSALERTVAAEQAARDRIQQIQDAAATTQADRTAQAEEKRLGAKSPEDQAMIIRERAQSAASEADLLAAKAYLANANGDSQAAERLAAESLKKAQQAIGFANRIQDGNEAANLIDLIAKAEQQAFGVQQATAKKAADELAAFNEQSRAALAEAEGGLAKLQTEVKEIEASIDALTNANKDIKITADVEKAQNDLAAIEAQLAAIPDTKVVNVVVSSSGGETPPIQANAAGGLIRGPGSDTSDNLLSWLSPGEFVIRAAAVRKYGAGMLASLNNMRLPKFANGGLVAGFSAPAPVAGGGASSMATAVFNFPELGRFETKVSTDTLRSIETAFAREALRRGRR